MTNEVYVNTAKTGSTITPTDPFETTVHIPGEHQKQYGSTTLVGDIIGVEKVSSYLSCCKCSKKIETSHSGRIVECKSCHVIQNVKSCSRHWYVHVLIKHNTEKITLSLKMV